MSNYRESAEGCGEAKTLPSNPTDSVNEQPSGRNLTAMEVHLMDVYSALGIKWGDDPFTVIAQLSEQGKEIERLRAIMPTTTREFETQFAQQGKVVERYKQALEMISVRTTKFGGLAREAEIALSALSHKDETK